MTLLNKISLSLLAAGSLLASCNDIDIDERYVELPVVEAQRTVLLEEFTGQFCTNCPDAHVVIKNLTAQYPDNLIVVSIHSGGDAFSLGEGEIEGAVGLRLPEGEAYYAAAGVNALPAGVINRTSGVQTSSQWSSSIRDAVKQPSCLDLQVEANLLEGGTQIEIVTNIDPHNNYAGNLQLWIVENNITAMQILPNGDFDMNYVHNHVYRGAVNGTAGQNVNLVIREPQEFTHLVNVKPNWNVDNLSVVAFVYNSAGVEQAAHAEVRK